MQEEASPEPLLDDDRLPTESLRRSLVIGVTALVLVAVALVAVAIRAKHQPLENRVTKNVPLAISCPVVGDCMVVDDQGNAVSFHDARWSAPRAVDSSELEDVSCATPRFCVAVDINGGEVTLTGSRWSRPVTIDKRAAGLVTTGSDGLNTVTCPVVDYCRAADATGRTLVFNGTHWSHRQDVEPRKIYREDPSSKGLGVISLSCVSASFCGAISQSGNAEIFVDHHWSSDPIETRYLAIGLRFHTLPALAGISCGTGFCVVVNSLGTTWVYADGTWSKASSYDQQDSQTLLADGPTAISCVARTFCMAVDDSGNASTFNGSSWSTPTRIDRSGLGLAAVSCASPGFCGALNHLGQVLILRGSSWSGPTTVDRAPNVQQASQG